MTKNDINDAAITHDTMGLEQKKRWFSPAAPIYYAVRPKYPESIIQFAISTARLSSKSKLLEIGCGPGTATISFASQSIPMVCVEPNADFFRLACGNCKAYPNVEIKNYSFEEWEGEPESFNGVLAASSIHWVSSDIAYKKAAVLLAKHGYLILLWNMILMPSHEVNQRLDNSYRVFAPNLIRPEAVSMDTQEQYLTRFGQLVIESSLFEKLVYHFEDVVVTYSADKYLSYLSTCSHYIALESVVKEKLFNSIRKIIVNEFGDKLDLTYRAACHVAQKIH